MPALDGGMGLYHHQIASLAYSDNRAYIGLLGSMSMYSDGRGESMPPGSCSGVRGAAGPNRIGMGDALAIEDEKLGTKDA